MLKTPRALAGASLFGVALYGLASSPAMALPPLQCQDFVNFAMDISQKYSARSCPRTPLMHTDRERHFQWCLGKNEAQVLADRRAKNATWQNCQAGTKKLPGDANFCGSYALQLVNIWDQGAAKGCPHFVSRRSRNSYDGHFKWCMSQSRPVAEKAIRDNRANANTCI